MNFYLYQADSFEHFGHTVNQFLVFFFEKQYGSSEKRERIKSSEIGTTTSLQRYIYEKYQRDEITFFN